MPADRRQRIGGGDADRPIIASENGESARGRARMIAAMTLDADACWRALSAHDARFDGRFYVGVATTGIYCRPVCNVRTPRRENCRFFASAAAAEARGFRPCLRCRPELAPGHAAIDASSRLAQGAVDLIESGAMDEGGLARLAGRVGVSDRHLRRVFDAEFGVSPVEYAQTHRLLLAKRLLTDTRLPVTDVALASGFSSVRRFNALFRERYRMAPSRLRRDAADGDAADWLAFELAYRPPYDFDALLAFLRARAVEGIETAGDTAYSRTIAIRRRGRTHAGRVEVRHHARRHSLRVSLSASLAGVVPAALGRARHAFDLAADPGEIGAVLGDLARAHPGLRVPGTFDGFELAVRAIVGQQVSVKAARTLLARLVAAHGEPLALHGAGPGRLFPTAQAIAALAPAELAHLGLVASRARAVQALAAAVAAGAVDLDPGADVEATTRALVALPGIGDWTASYIAMRALRWPDAFLAGDLVVKRALGVTTSARAEARSAAWRPWRAYAVMHLWKGAT
ncbi:putative bifunctional transcriptional activator/DNA repair enzyme AlkA [Burkholderiales bacterium]|nr:putative bifunctional transcriptional activator/DNA repair enzyme AlkA [Burkholderiales bacterium]